MCDYLSIPGFKLNHVSKRGRWRHIADNTGNQRFSMPATVYLKKYAHGFVVLCFVVVMQSFIMNSHEVFIHIHLGCFAGTGAIVRLPQCQWSKPDGYGKISQCITTTKHSKAKTVCIFLGIYCTCKWSLVALSWHPQFHERRQTWLCEECRSGCLNQYKIIDALLFHRRMMPYLTHCPPGMW